MTVKDIKKDEEIASIMAISEEQLDALGFTEHSTRHCSIVSKCAGEILRKIGATEREIRLAEIAGFLHDIGNAVNRIEHAQSGAILAYDFLIRRGMNARDAAEIMMAIGNHDESTGCPVSNISAALIIADKADVHKSRVRKNVRLNLPDGIHDRVNLAAESSFVSVDVEHKEIVLELVINTNLCDVMDYFEIYQGRMQLCRKAARHLGYKFALSINNLKLM